MLLRDSTIHRDYDEMARPVHRATTTLATGATAVWDGAYDALGELTNDATTGGGFSWSNQYGYDGAGRLTTEQRGRDGRTFEYVLDMAGRRLQTLEWKGGVPGVTMNATYAGAVLANVDGVPLSYDPWEDVVGDQYGNAFVRSADGEVLRVTSGKLSHRLLRDANGVPVALDEGAPALRVTHWDLDPAALPVEVRDATGASLRYLSGAGILLGRDETHGGASSGNELSEDRAGAVTRWGGQPLDHGSAFGADVTAPPGVDERFLLGGMESLPGIHGVYMSRHRAYDAETGRFDRPDPIGLLGGLHRFTYADGDPVQKSDPLGFCSDAQSLHTHLSLLQYDMQGLWAGQSHDDYLATLAGNIAQSPSKYAGVAAAVAAIDPVHPKDANGCAPGVWCHPGGAPRRGAGFSGDGEPDEGDDSAPDEDRDGGDAPAGGDASSDFGDQGEVVFYYDPWSESNLAWSADSDPQAGASGSLSGKRLRFPPLPHFVRGPEGELLRKQGTDPRQASVESGDRRRSACSSVAAPVVAFSAV